MDTSGDDPVISIGLPTYNGSRYIEATVDSLLAQTYENFELIISDNGSEDSTEDICRAYAKRDERIRYYRHADNRGAAWNYNFVFHESRGQYFKWSADDDLCDASYLEVCANELDHAPDVVLVFTHTPHIDMDSQVTGESELGFDVEYDEPHLRFHRLICTGHDCRPVFGLIRSEVLKTTPLIARYVGSDRGLIAELALRGRFREIKEDLQFRRIHPKGTERSFAGRAAERLSWFDPQRSGKPSFREWGLFRSYLGGIRRSSLNVTERLLCYKEILRWLGWGHARMLWSELAYGTVSRVWRR